jgi:hypothetical protein
MRVPVFRAVVVGILLCAGMLARADEWPLSNGAKIINGPRRMPVTWGDAHGYYFTVDVSENTEVLCVYTNWCMAAWANCVKMPNAEIGPYQHCTIGGWFTTGGRGYVEAFPGPGGLGDLRWEEDLSCIPMEGLGYGEGCPCFNLMNPGGCEYP